MTSLQRRLAEAEPWSVVPERDLLYLLLTGGEVMMIACDSDGGIGPKASDTVACPGLELGRFAARVPLLEVVAAGGTPVALVDTLSVEREPTGAAILEGVYIEARSAGLPDDAVTGSTEDNVTTVATGVGVTVIGRATMDSLCAGKARRGDLVVLLGRPMSAPVDHVTPEHSEVLDVPALVRAMGLEMTHEALPIGSGGVSHELRQLAASAGLGAEAFPDWPVDQDQSGGPSTSALLVVDGMHDPDTVLATVRAATGLPAWVIARLI